jgi:hypothetical protein
MPSADFIRDIPKCQGYKQQRGTAGHDASDAALNFTEISKAD